MYTVQRIIRGCYKIERNNVIIRSLCSKDIIDMPETSGITIPPYIEKKDETMAVRKARLLYQSRKRGMLENDLLLSTFACKYLEGMNMEQLSIYDQLINQPSNEWDLYYWAIGNKPIPDEFKSEIMDLLVEHAKNRNKEKRIRQPNLY